MVDLRDEIAPDASQSAEKAFFPRAYVNDVLEDELLQHMKVDADRVHSCMTKMLTEIYRPSKHGLCLQTVKSRVCANCKSYSFELDAAAGDSICVDCGVVDTSRLMLQGFAESTCTGNSQAVGGALWRVSRMTASNEHGRRHALNAKIDHWNQFFNFNETQLDRIKRMVCQTVASVRTSDAIRVAAALLMQKRNIFMSRETPLLFNCGRCCMVFNAKRALKHHRCRVAQAHPMQRCLNL